MFDEFNLEGKSENIIGINSDKKRTFNGKTFEKLNSKKKKLDFQFKTLIKEKNNLLFYYTLNPIKIKKDINTKYKITKHDLNKLFIESKDKRLHKEIYDKDLYKLINPYYLVKEKKYISPKYISTNIQKTFNQEEKAFRERENNNFFSNKFYDKNKNITFELLSKEHKFSRINDATLLNEAVKDHCFIVKLQNDEDSFNKIVLLRPSFTVGELKSLIKFIYKSVYKVDIIEDINLYYYNNLYSEITIENNNKNLKDLSKEMKADLELEIMIQALY